MIPRIKIEIVPSRVYFKQNMSLKYGELNISFYIANH